MSPLVAFSCGGNPTRGANRGTTLARSSYRPLVKLPELQRIVPARPRRDDHTTKKTPPCRRRRRRRRSMPPNAGPVAFRFCSPRMRAAAASSRCAQSAPATLRKARTLSRFSRTLPGREAPSRVRTVLVVINKQLDRRRQLQGAAGAPHPQRRLRLFVQRRVDRVAGFLVREAAAVRGRARRRPRFGGST